MLPSFEIDVFHGQLSPHAAQVYARVERLPGGQEWVITGRVRGPECRHAKTLPTDHAFVDLGAGETLLARATVPDPCFWSPDLPALYRVTLELRRYKDVVQTAERELGMRFFGTRGKSFYLEGKRWVMRAVSRASVDETPLADWRDASAAMLVHNPSEEVCCEASREGVFLVADAESGDELHLRRLSRWASVGIIVSSAPSNVLAEVRRRIPNVMLAQYAWPDVGGPIYESCAAMFVDATELSSQGTLLTASSLPTVAVRQIREALSLTEARDACDLLQRDLAQHGDFAGYVIDHDQQEGNHESKDTKTGGLYN